PRLTHVSECREMVSRARANRLEDVAHALRVSDVTLAIDAVDLVAALAQVPNQLRANEPRCAGHESTHQFSFAIAYATRCWSTHASQVKCSARDRARPDHSARSGPSAR